MMLVLDTNIFVLKEHSAVQTTHRTFFLSGVAFPWLVSRDHGNVLTFFVSRYLEVVTEFLEGEICKVLGVKKEIKSLTENLVKITCLIQDAERKRRGSAVINNWVRMLKDLMYDADDIIDLCTIEGGKLLEAPPASASAVSSPLGFVSSCFKCTKYRHEIATKIEALNARLKEMADFNALVPEIVSATQEPQPHKTTTRETSPLEVEEDIVGEQIEVAAHNLIDAMLQKNKQMCRVFGIVGMGGIGTTTLARKLYNDQRIKDNFPISKWLFVSKDYSEIDLLKELVRCAAEVQNLLREKVGFVVGHDDPTNEMDEGCDLEELRALSELRYLRISKLERGVATGSASVLAEKRFLSYLLLSWMHVADDGEDVEDDDDGVDEDEENEDEEEEEDSGDGDSRHDQEDEEETERAEKIYNELSPPTSLQDLTINQFSGRRLPGWMVSHSLGQSFANLEYLKLWHFPSCTELPPLGMLPQLKYLEIISFKAVKTIGVEFLGCSLPVGSSAFPKLEHLEFNDMPSRLGRMLRALPEVLSHATNLKELYLCRAHDSREVTNLRLNDVLSVTDKKKLNRISNVSVKCLEVHGCPNLEHLDNLDRLPHVKLICPLQMEQLPQWFSSLIEQSQSSPSAQWIFRKFELKCGLELLKSCLKGNQYWHIIQQIPDVKIQTYLDEEYVRYAKDPYMYDTNDQWKISAHVYAS
ncbi:Disease resistance protein [Musa troglodytarum]|uniref:Disease resistance protein n=1 Tax=Musa troglodytarum TaxID=320322 RepID=A0A9E7I737_9LILI|nr:Disease resistance protein [Musa troglodytarum]